MRRSLAALKGHSSKAKKDKTVLMQEVRDCTDVRAAKDSLDAAERKVARMQSECVALEGRARAAQSKTLEGSAKEKELKGVVALVKKKLGAAVAHARDLQSQNSKLKKTNAQLARDDEALVEELDALKGCLKARAHHCYCFMLLLHATAVHHPCSQPQAPSHRTAHLN